MATTGLAGIVQQLQTAQQAANQANKRRYQQGFNLLTKGRGTARSYYDQAADQIDVMGRGATEDVERGATRALAAGRQSLMSAGLGNTTIAANLPRGVEEDRRRAMQSVEEQRAQQAMGLLTQRAGAELGASGQLAGFIGSRTDTGPDLGLYASLMQAAAAAPAAGRTAISGGIGPNAAAGTSVFGTPFKYGSGGTGSGGSAFSGGGSGGGNTPAGPAQYFGVQGSLDHVASAEPEVTEPQAMGSAIPRLHAFLSNEQFLKEQQAKAQRQGGAAEKSFLSSLSPAFRQLLG